MQGPSAAQMRAGRRPSPAIAATVASTTPASAPLQPACAAPIDARLGVREQDHAAVGAGDAESQARRRGDERVAARPRVGGQGARDRRDVGRMDLVGNDADGPGATPNAAAMRARFSAHRRWQRRATRRRRSARRRRPAETPPRRVKNAWRSPGRRERARA